MTFEQFVSRRRRMTLDEMVNNQIFDDYINDFRDELDQTGVRECLVYPGPIFIEIRPAGAANTADVERYHLQIDSNEIEAGPERLSEMEELCYSFAANEGLLA